MLPMLASLDFLDELGSHELGASGHAPVGLGAQVKALHPIVRPARKRVLELAVEPRWADQAAKLVGGRRSAVDDRHRMDARLLQQFESRGQIEEDLPSLVVDVKLEEVVRQTAVMHRMPRVQPFAEEKQPVL